MARYSKAAYIEIATALRMLFDQHKGDAVPKRLAVRALADIFESDNWAFDRERFVQGTKLDHHAS